MKSNRYFMKSSWLIFYNLAVLSLLFLFSCNDSCVTSYSYNTYEPVYLTLTELRESVSQSAPEGLNTPGKIYWYNHYLFINETGKGIHIIDDSNPSAPVNLSFLNIDGNFDMAVKDNVLYADSYIDLLVFNISNPAQVILIKRINNVFNSSFSLSNTPEGIPAVITDWKMVKITTVYNNCEGPDMNQGGGNQILFANNSALSPVGNYSQSAPEESGTGIGGSLARFAVVGNNLYTVSSDQMCVFGLKNPQSPDSLSAVYPNGGIETLFSYKNNLFIGSQSGMQIYSLSDPDNPRYISTYTHITSCDPVVANDSVAFVTLRTGNPCRVNVNVNELDVVDIRDLYHPYLITSYAMLNPHGLGLDGNTLFLCEGDYGLKIFDVSDLIRIDANLIDFNKNIQAYDVIPLHNLLITIGDGGLYQYDYSDLKNIKLLSQLSVASQSD